MTIESQFSRLPRELIDIILSINFDPSQARVERRFRDVIYDITYPRILRLAEQAIMQNSTHFESLIERLSIPDTGDTTTNPDPQLSELTPGQLRTISRLKTIYQEINRLSQKEAVPFENLDLPQAIQQIAVKEDQSLISFAGALFLIIPELTLYIYSKYPDFDSTKSLDPKVQAQLAKDLREWFKTHPEICQRLMNLDLSHCRLKSLPREIKHFSNLRILNLAHNNVTVLPEEVGELSRIKILTLSHNQLTSLPSSLCNLKQLKILYIDSNQISTFPLNFHQLENLEELHASSNLFTALPTHIERLSKLKVIDVPINHLSCLPSKVGTLVDLELLDARRNQLTHISKSLVALSAIRW